MSWYPILQLKIQAVRLSPSVVRSCYVLLHDGRTLYSRVVLSPFVQHLVMSNYHKGIKGVGLTSPVIHNLVVIGPTLSA